MMTTHCVLSISELPMKTSWRVWMQTDKDYALAVSIFLQIHHQIFDLFPIFKWFHSARQYNTAIVWYFCCIARAGESIGANVKSTGSFIGIKQKVWIKSFVTPIDWIFFIIISIFIFFFSICLITKHGISGIIVKKND